MAEMTMPPARDYGWALKPVSSAEFGIERRPNGQFCCVLNHSLLRGVTAEMIHWWFLNFANLTVRFEDVPGWEGKRGPAYLLWHPSDHVDARLSGPRGPGGAAQAGATIHIIEAMQYETYGLRYPVDAALRIFYCAGDGWAMGKDVPLIGRVMCLRIHYVDAYEDGAHIGVHYHYEIVIGSSLNNVIGRFVNRRLTAQFAPEFFEAWRLHNTIEVGVFENFLPALYEQRDEPQALSYACSMDSAPKGAAPQLAYDPELFQRRLAGFREAADPHVYQAAEAESFLKAAA